MTPTKPIDARQHVWWNRLRRLGPWWFVGLGGGVLAPLFTVVLFAAVIAWYGYPWISFVSGATVMWIVTAPVYIGAWFWTWKHMEKRYLATLAVRCPGCGYSRRGIDGRCPECGAPAPEEAPDLA